MNNGRIKKRDYEDKRSYRIMWNNFIRRGT